MSGAFVYINGDPVNPNGIQIPAKDLSTISTSADDIDRLFHHDGTNVITLVDGSLTDAQGHYTYDPNGNGGDWRPILGEATHLGGLTNDDLVQETGDSMSGDLRIDTNSDSVIELLSTGFNNSAISMGASSGEGAQMRYDSGEIQFGELNNGVFTAHFIIDVSTGETTTQ